MERSDTLKRVIEAAGGVNNLARHCGVFSQAVSQWRHVPVHHVLTVEKLTGMSRHELRPDIYGDTPDQQETAA